MTPACTSCSHDNREGARFCDECGNALEQRCGSCGNELRAGAKFCDGCGTPVGGSAADAGQEARKTVTIVFTDLVGSTSLQEQLDAESVKRVMARYYAAAREAIESLDGRVVKFMGDGMMAVFGSPVVREDDALRAVRAAAAMNAVLAELNVELERDWGIQLRMRTGVNTGEVVAARHGGDLVGDPVNVAARLEQAAGEGEVFLGPDTARMVRHDVQLEAVAPLELKGKREPTPAFRLVSLEPAPGGARIEAPLVGRDEELARLLAAFDDAEAARRCRLVTVIGFPGIGKTRLTHEVAAALGDRATVVRGHCEASGEGATLLPVAEVLRDAAGIGESDDPGTVRDKLGGLLPDDDDERNRVLERLSAVLGLGPQAPPEETFWAVRRLLEAATRRHPLVVVLDDVHWGEPTFLDLIEHLVEWVADAPILVLALARPELRDQRQALTSRSRAFDVVDLEPLDADDSRELAGKLLDRAALPPELAARVLEATEGNPLFLGEMLRMLVDDGVLRRDGDAWVTAGDASAVDVPPSIQALLAARIERLADGERAVVERAAVVGRQFYRGAVADLAPSDVRVSIDSHLETLRRKELVEPEGIYWIDEPVFRFHHVLIRDAAYRSLLKEARAELHERFAGWLEAKAGELVGDYEEIVAFHLEQAHEYRRQLGRLDGHAVELGRRAAERLHSAGLRALDREDLPAAANLLGRALERMEEADATRPAVLADLVETQLSAGDAQAAAATTDTLSELTAGDPRLTALTAVYAAQLASLTGSAQLEERVETVVAAAEALTAAGDQAGVAKAHHVRAQTLALLGRVGEVEAALDEALAAARQAGDQRRARAVLAGAPRAALWGPSPVPRASGRCLDVVRILRMSSGGRHVEAAALRCQAVLEAMRRRSDAAREILARCRATAEELGLRLELCETGVHAGIVELIAGDARAAERELRAAYDGFTDLGAEAGAAHAAALLARALLLLGELDEAEQLTRESEQRAGDDLKTIVAWCSARAQVLAFRGEHDQAEALARRAVGIAELTDALVDHADARLTLAAVLRVAGREDEAIAEAGRAAELYRSKQDASGMERAVEFGAAVRDAEPAAEPAAVPDGSPTGAAEAAPVVITRELAEAVNRGDWHGAARLLTDDFVNEDHRTGTPMERIADGASFIERMQSMVATAADARGSVERVIGSVGDVMACDYAWRGHWDDGGGAFELPMRLVSVRRGGCLERLELFDPEGEGAVARYEKLAREGATGPVWELVSEWFRAWERHDLDAIAALFHDDFVRVDHSRHRWPQMDREETLAQYRSILDGAPDARFEWVPADQFGNAYLARGDMAGSASDGEPEAGEWKVSQWYVGVVRDGCFARFEYFDLEDEAQARARLLEFGAERPEAVLAGGWAVVSRWREAFNSSDWNAFAALHASEFRYVDHSALRWPELNAAEALGNYRSIKDVAPDYRLRFGSIADAGAACLFRWRGRGSVVGELAGAEAEVEHDGLNVSVVRDGRLVRMENFDPHDQALAECRMRELAEREEPAVRPNAATRLWERWGDGLNRRDEAAMIYPPERLDEALASMRKLAGAGMTDLVARWTAALNARDLEGLRALATDGFTMSDHRPASIGVVEGIEPYIEYQRGAIAESSDATWSGEVETERGSVAGGRLTVSGTLDASGGEWANELLVLVVREGNRVARFELFPEDDRPAMLRRLQELAGTDGEPASVRLTRRFWELANAEEWAAADALGSSADYRLVDHRPVGWGSLNSSREVVAMIRGLAELAPDLDARVEAVLAADDVACAFRFRSSGDEHGGEFEIALIGVMSAEDGRITRAEIFPPDDEPAALACFERLRGRPEPDVTLRAVRGLLRWLAYYNAHEWERIDGLYDEDFRLVDHRKVGWGELDYAGLKARWQGLTELTPDFHHRLDAILAASEDVVAARTTVRGHDASGGEFEMPIIHVHVAAARDGEPVVRRTEFFDAEDEAEALASFERLRGASAG